MDLYHQQILDLYKHPLNKGVLATHTVKQHELNPTCGDELTLYLDIRDGVIFDVAWEGIGCAISMASSALVTEELRGKSVEEVRAITPDDIVGWLGIELGPTRLKCALLVLQALRNGMGKESHHVIK